MRRILKSPFIYSIMDRLGPTLTWRMAMLSRSFLSKKHKPYDRVILERFRRYGRKKLGGATMPLSWPTRTWRTFKSMNGTAESRPI